MLRKLMSNYIKVHQEFLLQNKQLDYNNNQLFLLKEIHVCHNYSKINIKINLKPNLIKKRKPLL
jgi:hypothetical protein